MERLSNATLGRLPRHILRPLYARPATARIVHLGAGNFLRGHQAVYTDQVMGAGDPSWGIFAASLQNPALGQALAPQDSLYTVLVNDNGTFKPQLVGSLARIACLADARTDVLEALCSPHTEIVTLTLTEKGYGYDPALEGLDFALPAVQLDVNAPQSARSALGLLAWAIHQRKQRGLPPFTLLSCDHLPANGKILQRVLGDYIERVQDDLNDPGLLQYFMDQYACPCSLVDRSVRTATADEIAGNEQLLGLHDAAPVVTEPFTQWIIQDWFSAARPAWEKAGAILAAHVAPFELAQSVLLDAGRFALAHLGALAGHKTLTEAMAEPEIARYIAGLLDDAMASLPRHAGFDWNAYKQQLLERFGNSALAVSTAQTCIDGSVILVKSLLPPIRTRMARGLNIEHHATAVAAWMRCLTGRSERQEELHHSDPLQERLAQAVQAAGGRAASAFDLAEALLGVREVFGPDLSTDLEFSRRVTAALQDLLSVRVLGALKLLNNPELRTAPL